MECSLLSHFQNDAGQGFLSEFFLSLQKMLSNILIQKRKFKY